MTEPIGEQRPRVDEIPLLLSLYACSLIYEIRCGALGARVRRLMHWLAAMTGNRCRPTKVKRWSRTRNTSLSTSECVGNSPIPKQVQVAAIHLGPGQSVKVISDARSENLEGKMAPEPECLRGLFACGWGKSVTHCYLTTPIAAVAGTTVCDPDDFSDPSFPSGIPVLCSAVLRI